jgi:hypothetical protein
VPTGTAGMLMFDVFPGGTGTDVVDELFPILT